MSLNEFRPQTERIIATADENHEAQANESEKGPANDVQQTPRNVRSFYSTHQSTHSAHLSDAASKAMAMWPDAARTKEFQAHAERDASPGSEPKSQQASDEQASPSQAEQPAQTASPQPEQPAQTTAPQAEKPAQAEQSSPAGQATKPAQPKPQEQSAAPKQTAQPAQPAPATPATPPRQPAQAKHAAHRKPRKNPSRKPFIIGAGVVVALVALIVVLVSFLPITVTVNGQQVQIAGTKTIATAIEKAGIDVTPGNFLAVDGSVLTEGAGQPFDATIDDENTSDPRYVLEDGAVIEVANGSDIMEEFTLSTESAPFSTSVEGSGAIHTLSGTGQDGQQEVRTGSVSGLQTITVTEDPVNIVCTYQNAHVGDQKVVALTFDDGPNGDFTPQILDVLERNGASATFFTIGSRITGENIDIVQRAYNAGHQICTHSWDHAAGSGNGVDLSHMTKEEQIDEILKGYEAIEAALGTEASHIIRTPGGNFPPEVITNLSPYITSEIGWNIDTQDWTRPGTAAIKAQILSAKPGDIILMHDGGGDRSQTVQALSETLPVLKQRGFQFVTIDQLFEIIAANG